MKGLITTPVLRNYEKNTGKSMTIPDQAMSIAEIMRRFKSGLPITGGRTPVYNGTIDGAPMLPEFEKLDIEERYEILAEARDNYAKLKKEHDDEKAKQRQKRDKQRYDQELNAAIEKRLKAKELADIK